MIASVAFDFSKQQKLRWKRRFAAISTEAARHKVHNLSPWGFKLQQFFSCWRCYQVMFVVLKSLAIFHKIWKKINSNSPALKLKQTSLLIVQHYKRRYWSWKKWFMSFSRKFILFFCLPTWLCMLEWDAGVGGRGRRTMANGKIQIRSKDIFMRYWAWDLRIRKKANGTRRRDYINLLTRINVGRTGWGEGKLLINEKSLISDRNIHNN